MKKGVGKTQNYYIKMDDIPAYVSDAPVDIGGKRWNFILLSCTSNTNYFTRFDRGLSPAWVDPHSLRYID